MNKRIKTVEGLKIQQEPPKCRYGEYEMVVRSQYTSTSDRRWIEWRFTVTDSNILEITQKLSNLGRSLTGPHTPNVFCDIERIASETYHKIMDMVMEDCSFSSIKEVYDKAAKDINKNNYAVDLIVRNSPNSFTNTKVKLFPDFESTKAFIETEAKSIETFPNPEFFVHVDKIDFISGQSEFVCRAYWNSSKHKVVFEYERY